MTAGLKPLMALALVAALTGCVDQSSPAGPTPSSPVGVNVTPPAEREAAPDINGPTLDGGQLALRDLRGSTVVLNAWASWCAPCKEELPLLAAAARNAGPNVRFVGLDVKDSPERARQMQEKYGVDYPSIIDEKGAWFRQLPGLPRALPGTVIIDPKGRIRATIIGPVTQQDLDELLTP